MDYILLVHLWFNECLGCLNFSGTMNNTAIKAINIGANDSPTFHSLVSILRSRYLDALAILDFLLCFE